MDLPLTEAGSSCDITVKENVISLIGLIDEIGEVYIRDKSFYGVEDPSSDELGIDDDIPPLTTRKDERYVDVHSKDYVKLEGWLHPESDRLSSEHDFEGKLHSDKRSRLMEIIDSYIYKDESMQQWDWEINLIRHNDHTHKSCLTNRINHVNTTNPLQSQRQSIMKSRNARLINELIVLNGQMKSTQNHRNVHIKSLCTQVQDLGESNKLFAFIMARRQLHLHDPNVRLLRRRAL